MNWESATGCEGRRKHRVNMESTSVYAGGGGVHCRMEMQRTSIYAGEVHA